MKKQLLSLAFAAALLPAFNASAEPALTEVWKYQSEVLNDGWNGDAPNWASPDAIKAKPCARFATGRDGKMYTVNMMTMSIAEITPEGMVDRYKLPSLAGRSFMVGEVDTPDYYGTSISMDDAGNFLVGHLFTKAPYSSTIWSVYSPSTGKIKHFDLGTGDKTIGRMDCVGRVVGDLTRDAVFYVAPASGLGEANQVVRMVKVHGEGNVDGVSMTSEFSPMVYLGATHTQNVAQPKYATIEETLAASKFEDTFYMSSCSGNGQWSRAYSSFVNGEIDWAWQTNMQKNIFAATNGFDSFVLGGQRYFVRNYIPSDQYSTNPNTMDIAVLDENGEIVAVWNNPEYVTSAGYSSITAQVIDDNSAYIHVYASTGSPKPGFGAAAVLYFSASGDTNVDEGSKANPIKITTPADLCNMNVVIAANKDRKIYFVLENDIDMAGVTDYTPAIGYTGTPETYYGEFSFDGQYHVIKNFAPEAKHSYMSLFGMVRGDVKNLGIENCNIVSNSLGAAVLGAYGSHGGINCNIDNVWATGSVKCTVAGYAGGLIGTNGNNLTITNSYFNGSVNGTYAGGLVGRARAGVTIKNSYAAGTVVGTTKAGGIAGTDKDATVAIALENVIAWNSSVKADAADAVTLLGHADATGVQVWDGMKVNDVAVTNGVAAADLIAAATSWSAYNKQLIDGYPALAWQNIPAPLGTEANPYKISTKEDLCNMNVVIADNKDRKIYFVLENDIDMAGVTDYTPAIGYTGSPETYYGEFSFDGQYHVIKNFAPEAKHSYMSLFGMVRGDVKNLGIENCNIVSNSLGAAVLGAYGSHGGINCNIDNVWATGSVKCTVAGYAGGLIGTNGNNLTITNSYFNGSVNGTYAGGLVGRARAGVTIKNSYAAGTVVGTTKAGGIAGTDKDATVAIALENVIAWNSSVKADAADAVTLLGHADATGVQVWDGMKVNDVAVEGGVSALDLQIASAGWAAYRNLIDGYPALAWQKATEEVSFYGSTAENPYKISVAADLVNMSKAMAKVKDTFYAELAADIDMTDVAYTPIAPALVVNLDGKNHVISNLKISAAQAALFYNFKGSIKNIGVENAEVASNSQWGTAGIFTGYGVDAVIENSYATGSVKGFYAGGFSAGVAAAGKLVIRNCYSDVAVEGVAGYAGGFVGACNEGASLEIENVYAAGSSTAPNYAAGIAAGINPAYNAATINLKNVVAWNSAIDGAAADAVMCPSAKIAGEITNALVWDGLLLNGAAVEGAKTAYELQVEVTGWEAFNDKLKDGMPVLAWQEATEDVVDPDAVEGSEKNPYKISTEEDLCNMNVVIAANKDRKIYFVLENDIDMAGVTDYTPAIGYTGSPETYYGEFSFDGQCHVIKNFAPEAKHSYMSLFGMVRGDVKNLGIENCNIVSNSLGAAVLGAYGSHGGINCNIDNVWATGSVKCTAGYAGGLIGTNGNDLTITNSYFNGSVNGKYAGGLVGRARAGVTIKNSYAAGTVVGTANAGGIAGTDKDATVTIVLENVIAWNSSVKADAADAVTLLGHADATGVQVWEGMKVNDAVVTNGVAASTLEATAMGWEAYADYLVNGMPALKWQPKGEGDGVEGIDADNADVAPVYYNLQGVRVENPESGLYIVKRGNKVTKEIVR